MRRHSVFLACPQCHQKVRHFTKDLGKVTTRVCPKCGQVIRVSEAVQDEDPERPD